jgi:hypothetical protein
MDKRAVEEGLAAREEAHLIDEFRRNLEYNLGKVGRWKGSLCFSCVLPCTD